MCRWHALLSPIRRHKKRKYDRKEEQRMEQSEWDDEEYGLEKDEHHVSLVTR